MNTPFWDACRALAQKRTRFFVPGHKANPAAIPPFGEWLIYDLTEIAGADDLSAPSGPLAQSEENMARLYGSGATLYSASGSTSCILAMLTLFVGPGRPVVMARGCHAAAVRALAFLDARPTWVLPREGQVAPADVEAALAASGAGAVYITSPDYFGRMADIPALAAVCRKAGAALLVDNAHGAYLRFLPKDMHPLSLGADATADSAHKTLPCLTPAALLHLRNGAQKQSARQALNLYCSTSPSYPVLQSLDLAAGLLAETPPDFAAAAARLSSIRQRFSHLVFAGRDPLKLCLRPAKGGWTAEKVRKALENVDIFPELADGEHIVLMASPYNTEEDFSLLESVLAGFPLRAPLALVRPQDEALPVVATGVRAALLGPKRAVPLYEALGRVCAGIAAPCPPGVPVVMPGEVVDETVRKRLAAGGISHLDVVE